MPDIYNRLAVGVKDGTKNPPDRFDGRMVGAARSTIVAPKVAGQAIASGDQFYIGTLKPGERISDIRIITDTSLGTATVAIGPKTATGKYRAAAVFTTPLNVPASIGPSAAAAILDPVTADEDIWATFAVAGVAGGVVLCFELDIVSVK
jgi:hypothetical protein